MLLSTGRHIHAYQWTVIPIDNYAIDHVDELSEDEDKPPLTNGYTIFEWRTGDFIDEKDDVQDTEETDDDYIQDTSDIYDQAYQNWNKTEYEHDIDEKKSNSENGDYYEVDK